MVARFSHRLKTTLFLIFNGIALAPFMVARS
jgi:hypothetical protein